MTIRCLINVVQDRRLIAVAAAMVLAGCIPDSINPLGDPAAETADTEVIGQWIGTLDGTPTKMEVTAEDGAMLSFRLETDLANGDREWVMLKGFPAAVENERYMNVKLFAEEDKVYDPRDENYYIFRYNIRSDGTLNVWAMGEQPVVNAIVDGFVNGAVDPSSEGRVIHITDSTIVVRQLIEVSNPDRLFPVKYASFRRMPQ